MGSPTFENVCLLRQQGTVSCTNWSHGAGRWTVHCFQATEEEFRRVLIRVALKFNRFASHHASFICLILTWTSLLSFLKASCFDSEVLSLSHAVCAARFYDRRSKISWLLSLNQSWCFFCGWPRTDWAVLYTVSRKDDQAASGLLSFCGSCRRFLVRGSLRAS